MARVILTGNDSEVDKVIRENRLRVARGLVAFVHEEPGEPVKETVAETKTEKQGRKPKDSKKVSAPTGKVEI